jgi:hypothetical protein
LAYKSQRKTRGEKGREKRGYSKKKKGSETAYENVRKVREWRNSEQA